MSFNNGRRASAYPDISHLNTLPSEYDMSLQQPAANLDLETDLSLFTDGEFFNFDMGDMGDHPRIAYAHQPMSQPASAHPNAYSNGEYSEFSLLSHGQSLPGQGNMKPYSPANSAEHTASSSPHIGEKRKASAASPDAKGSPAEETNDPARDAAEEDKRRRNTAASARFRVKKKQREQAMEKTAKEMTDRVTFLENRVGALESENKILRDLLTDKIGKDTSIARVLETQAASIKAKSTDAAAER